MTPSLRDQFERLAMRLAELDALLSDPGVTADMKRWRALAREQGEARDIEPEVARVSDVYLYTVDDLSQLVQTAGEKRQAAVEQAEAIIDAGVQSFAHWMEQRAAVPLIQALNRQADDWGAVELARAKKRLAHGEPLENVLEALTRGITHKMLHGTLAELHAADGDERDQLASTVSRLFLRRSTRHPGGESR